MLHLNRDLLHWCVRECDSPSNWLHWPSCPSQISCIFFPWLNVSRTIKGSLYLRCSESSSSGMDSSQGYHFDEWQCDALEPVNFATCVKQRAQCFCQCREVTCTGDLWHLNEWWPITAISAPYHLARCTPEPLWQVLNLPDCLNWSDSTFHTKGLLF